MESIGVFDDWAQTATDANMKPDPDFAALTLGTLAQSQFQQLKTAREFIQVLKSLSVDGPLEITTYLESRHFIGEGGQFTVYRTTVATQKATPWETTPAAVKRSKIVLESNQILDLTGDDTKRQVHNMFLEVLVLRDPALRSHRNIVHLLGWAHEGGFNSMPLLVMELATEGDLTAYLNGPLGNSWDVRQHLCLDMAAGLDAIHENGIVHADLKPENVLVFLNDSEDVPLIAKLSDFGYAEPEAKSQSGSRIYITALSRGWQAPEISLTTPGTPPTSVTTSGYKKADNYSLGLVVWSVCCFRGQSPPANTSSNALSAALKMLDELPTLSPSLKETFSSALGQILRYDPLQRPEYTLQFFQDDSDATARWHRDNFRQDTLSTVTEEAAQNYNFSHPLKMQTIQQYHLVGPKKAFDAFGSDMNGGELFSLFLENTYLAIPADDNKNIDFETLLTKQLLLSAERGFVPAQAVAERVLLSYGIDWPAKYLPHRQLWLFEGAAIGCPIAQVDLRATDPQLADEATEEFYKRGGYQQHYYSETKRKLWKSWKAGSRQPGDSVFRIGLEKLGIASTHQEDSTEDKSSPTYPVLECRNSTDGTPLGEHELLYLSCLAGDSEGVFKLCRNGVDASVIGEPGGATCLHWLFVFPQHDMINVAALLIQSGAQVDARLPVTCPVTKHTFPYAWPPGTALHWAVAASSRHAVRVLLNNGADHSLRNGDDPYMYDLNIRYLEREGMEESQGSYSEPSGIFFGMNSTDLAACSHDFEILTEILETRGPSTSYLTTDEEGYTSFHRLQYNQIGRTYEQHRFSFSAFRTPAVRREAVFKTVQILKRMGGNIDALTQPSQHNPRRKDRPGPLTPLMLATRTIDLDTVTSLLKHGANHNIRNELGYNVLSQLPEKGDYHYCFKDLPRIIEVLLEYGSEISAKDPFKGCTPLACAVECGDLDVMRLLLKAGGDPTEKVGKLGVIALWVDNHSVYRYVCTWAKRTPWRQQDARMADILTRYVFSRCADDVSRVLNDVDDYGSGLLHYAVASGQPAVVEAVLNAGADAGAVRRKVGFGPGRDSGSALDICLQLRKHHLEKSRIGHENISPEEYRLMLEIYDEIKLMLDSHLEPEQDLQV